MTSITTCGQRTLARRLLDEYSGLPSSSGNRDIDALTAKQIRYIDFTTTTWIGNDALRQERQARPSTSEAALCSSSAPQHRFAAPACRSLFTMSSLRSASATVQAMRHIYTGVGRSFLASS
jgi:hypothetical protein